MATCQVVRQGHGQGIASMGNSQLFDIIKINGNMPVVEGITMIKTSRHGELHRHTCVEVKQCLFDD